MSCVEGRSLRSNWMRQIFQHLEGVEKFGTNVNRVLIEK